jgi:hypothetical protein
MDQHIKGMYVRASSGYWAAHWKDVLLTSAVVAGVIYFSAKNWYDAMLSEVRTDWNSYKCVPFVLPFAGVIMPNENESMTDTNINNFNSCMQTNVSTVLSTLIMPLEFAAFLIIDTLDVLINVMLASMAYMAEMKKRMSGVGLGIFDKLQKMLIPVTLFMLKIRDTLAKTSGVLMTMLYTVFTIYNIILSGLVNVLQIVSDLMLAAIIVILAIMVTALVLMATPAFPAGIALYATASVAVTTMVIPIVVMYALLHSFGSDTLHVSSPKPPDVPKISKKNKKNKKDNKKDNKKGKKK